ncbi:MAG: serine hydrolase domain-containing protein [Actinomycetaceae bacterium]|nr:serine hydrolase domain-containing protein [Actinomycetaceae bacterium]
MRSVVKRSLASIALIAATVLSACAGGGGASTSAPPITSTPMSGAAQSSSQSGAISQELTAENVNTWLDEYLPSALESQKIAGATVAVVKDGKVLTTRGFGYADTGNGGEGKPVPVDPEKHLFRVGSIAKIPTSIAVMQLVEQGKVDLDADISSYVDVPIKRRFDTPITVRHLLTHTAGFEDAAWRSNPPEGFDLEKGLQSDSPEQIFEPGTTPAYSNYGMTLAGFIVQKVSGQRFEDYAREHIFEPLGMDSTTYEQPLPEALRPRMSQGYSDSTQSALPFEIAPQPGGSLTSSAPDFAKFMIAQMNHDPRILKAETWEQMQTAAPNEKLGGMQKGDSMGLGYFVTQRNGHKVVGHAGDTPAFHSLYDVYPERGVAVFVSFNSMGNSPEPAYSDFGTRFADQFLPDVAPESSVSPEERIEHANQVTGTYMASQRTESNFLAQFTPEIKISASSNGNLLLPGNKEFTEGEPYVWREVGGDTRISADLSTGKPRLNIGGAGVVDLQTLNGTIMGMSVLAGNVLLGGVLLLWIIGGARAAFVRHRGYKPNVLGWHGRLARLGGILAMAMPFIWTTLTSIVQSSIYIAPPIPDWWIRGVQGLQLLAVLALIPGVWDVARAVREKRGWPRGLVSLALVVGLLAMACWAILGNTLNPDISY